MTMLRLMRSECGAVRDAWDRPTCYCWHLWLLKAIAFIGGLVLLWIAVLVRYRM